MLIILVMIALPAFSQPVIVKDGYICLSDTIARKVVKDLKSGDGCILELTLCLENNTYADAQLSNYRHIVAEKDKQISNLIIIADADSSKAEEYKTLYNNSQKSFKRSHRQNTIQTGIFSCITALLIYFSVK